VLGAVQGGVGRGHELRRHVHGVSNGLPGHEICKIEKILI
jgi:hypothetical protein